MSGVARGRSAAESSSALAGALRDANAAFRERHPGQSRRRQPAHTVIGGAHLFTARTIPDLGAEALRTLEQYAPDAATFADVLGLTSQVGGSPLAQTVYDRVVERLRRQPVEDYRIDFEDGYGYHTDAEEDEAAESTASAVALASSAGTLSPFIGIRIKPLTDEFRDRSVRTLELFVTALAREVRGRFPSGFTVTLAKVTVPEQVAFIAETLVALERRLGLPERTLGLEIMIETPQAVIGADGRSPLPLFRDAAGGRLLSAAFGTYDYTAGCGIIAEHQHSRHPACDFARHVMQVAFAGTGVAVTDGSTAVLPVGPHRASPDDGRGLTPQQVAANRESVHRGWKQHYDDVRHSLVNGFYQGWDLHAAQLPTRYAALYAFFLGGLESAAARLRALVDVPSRGRASRAIADDPATGQALLDYVSRAVNCGASDEATATEMTQLTAEELQSSSFASVLRTRLE